MSDVAAQADLPKSALPDPALAANQRPGPSAAPASRGRLDDIQILRALAILWVLAQHLSLTRTTFLSFPIQVTVPFWAGVELFFVISGFVVTRSVDRGSASALHFAMRRLFRLWPAMIAFLAFATLVHVLMGISAMPEHAQALFLVGQWSWWRQSIAIMFGYLIDISESGSYFFGAMWSLSVEFQFYAAFTLILWGLTTFNLRKHLMVAASIISAVLWTLTFLARLHAYNDAWVGTHVLFDNRLVGYIGAFRFDFLLVGVMIYAISRIRPSINLRPETASFLCVWLLGLPLVLLMVGEDVLRGPHPFVDAIALPVSEVCFGAVVFLASQDLAFPAKQSLAYRALKWVGDRSYSIYLFHFPVMALAWFVFWKWAAFAFRGVWWYGVLQAGFVLVATFLIADIVFRCIERPGIRIGETAYRRYVTGGGGGRSPGAESTHSHRVATNLAAPHLVKDHH